jgi:hypothetical protein
MKNEDGNKMDGTACPIHNDNAVTQYLREGQLCPNCNFAKLKKEPGNIIRCPVCGFGSGAGCT